ncbi:MAG TPA: hypothetical protein VGV87_22735 [Blastocatellia bacterium]|nr:hypothetical protein [Blastocatellia bacterium]
MKTRRTSTKLIVSSAAVLLLGTTIAGVTQRQDSPITRVPICVKENGQLRMLTGNNTACEPSERQMEWVVGGEVTEIQLGDGLVGGREDGAVRLALDPSIIAGCTGCRGGRVFAGFNDGPSMFPHNLLFETIAELNLPAGDYVIFAKLTLEALKEPVANIKAHVTCRLSAGSDFDEAAVVLEQDHTEGFSSDGSNVMGLNLQVVHSFSASGSVVLKGKFELPPSLGVDPPVRLRNLKIMAIEASDISNVFLGAN